MATVTWPRVRRNDYGWLSPPDLDAWQPTRTVSVVIPAYRGQAYLDLALAALSRQIYPPELLEVVVADDGSEPPLVLPEVRPANCRLVRVPEGDAGWGRAHALRVGAAASDGEILHWLDADLLPFPEHVAAQARWQHASPDVVTLGYKRFVRDGQTTVGEVLRRCADGTLGALFPPAATDPHDYVEEIIGATDQLRAADHLAFRAHVGATAAVDRALYLAAGGLDDSLRLGEDSELGYRLAQAGAVFVPEPHARSWHLGPSHMMRLGEALRRYNRPFLADRMPLPRWLRRTPGRGWAVPLVTAVVNAGPGGTAGDGAPLELVRGCVDRLLASDEHDLRVVLVADWAALTDQRRSVLADPLLDRRLLAATYRSDPRVTLADTVPESAFPSPYLLTVPVHMGVSPAAVGRVVAAADADRLGLLRLVPPGVSTTAIELWRTAAVSRARRHQRPGEPLADAVAEVWGAGWASGAEFGVVDLAAPVPPPAAVTAAAAAAAPVRPVPVAGLRSLLRATGYVGRLAAGRALRGAGRALRSAGRAWPGAGRAWPGAVHLPDSLRTPSPATVPPVSSIPPVSGIPLVSRVQALRRRVRLRTRLRRTRQAWQRAFPPRLPEWPEAPEPVSDRAPVASFPDGAAVVDATAANPRGRHRYGPRLPTGRLVVTEARWAVVREPDGTTVVAGRVGDPLDQRQAAVLAELGMVSAHPPATGHPATGAPPAGYAHVLAALAMTGVVVHTPALTGEAAGRLAPELAGLLRAPLPGRRADELEWEIRSVRQRRAAMRHHAAGLELPLVSAVLVTKRPHLVAAAVAALAAQTYPELEIVVGQHGHEGALPSSVDGRQIRVVPVPAERNLGEALAAATEVATGTLITKVDDDDRYGPEHIWDLVLARHYTGAAVVGKGAEMVYLEPKNLTVRRRMAAEVFTDTVAGGTLLLSRAELAAVGGWPAVPRWVDRALLDRVLGDGGRVYRTHPLGFVYTRHNNGHTWEADLDHFLHDARRKWRGLPPYAEFGSLGDSGSRA